MLRWLDKFGAYDAFDAFYEANILALFTKSCIIANNNERCVRYCNDSFCIGKTMGIGMAAKVDRRVRRTRRLLSEAFIELVKEKGYEAITVEDIVARADIGKTTFYVHFKGKRHLFEEVVEIYFKKWRHEVLVHMKDEQAYTKPDATVAAFEFAHREAAFFQLVFQDEIPIFVQRKLHNSFSELIQSLLEHLVGQLELTPTIPVEFMAEHSTGALLAVIKWWLVKGVDRYSAEEMAFMFRQLHLNGRAKAMGMVQS